VTYRHEGPAEIKLRPGWLANDVRRAQSRLEQWNGAWERANALPTQGDVRARQSNRNAGSHAERMGAPAQGGSDQRPRGEEEES
jgi:hypothetical protein